MACTSDCNMKTLNFASPPAPQISMYAFSNMNSRYYIDYIPRVSLRNEKCVFSVTHEINV